MGTTTMLDMCKRANIQKGKRITILGTGIAGLVAAYELERLGHEVHIMEGSPRVGGRVWTHRFGNSPVAPYAQLGAMPIPREHQRTLHYVKELGNKLIKWLNHLEKAFTIHLEGWRYITCLAKN